MYYPILIINFIDYVLLTQRIQFKLIHVMQTETTKLSTTAASGLSFRAPPPPTKFQRDLIIRITMKTAIKIKSKQTYKGRGGDN